MPLMSCPDCGNSVSTAASACPHCGRPVVMAKEKAADGRSLLCAKCNNPNLEKIVRYQSPNRATAGIVWISVGVLFGLLNASFLGCVGACFGLPPIGYGIKCLVRKKEVVLKCQLCGAEQPWYSVQGNLAPQGESPFAKHLDKSESSDDVPSDKGKNDLAQ